jgi:hypothetical protein
MHLDVSASLLASLREHRDASRLKRARRWGRWNLVRSVQGDRATSLVARVRELMDDGDPNVRKEAEEYMLSMDRLQDEVEAEHDAFLLEPGMGPMLYLTAEGRVLTDGRSWDGEALREATEDEAIAALVIGADKTGITELLSLLPDRPSDGHVCPMCIGKHQAPPLPGGPMIICLVCGGRGWVVQAMLDKAVAAGTWPRREHLPNN